MSSHGIIYQDSCCRLCLDSPPTPPPWVALWVSFIHPLEQRHARRRPECARPARRALLTLELWRATRWPRLQSETAQKAKESAQKLAQAERAMSQAYAERDAMKVRTSREDALPDTPLRPFRGPWWRL